MSGEREKVRQLERKLLLLRQEYEALAQFIERLKLERCAACPKHKTTARKK